MLTELSAYSNRWRQVSPIAKGLFSLYGMIAAFTAASAVSALVVALIIASLTIAGASVPLGRYLRVATPPLLFLLASALSLAITLDSGGAGFGYHLAANQQGHISHICSRSLACLASLLFLTLTTPLTDIIFLLRRLKTPDILLDIMVISYRTLFVLSETIHDTMTAQSARLGYATIPISFRSLGALVANLTVNVWQRSHALTIAAISRNSYGSFRFLEQQYRNTSRDTVIANASGLLLILLAAVLP